MPSNPSDSDTKICMLVDLGLSVKDARAALKASDGNVDHAIDSVLDSEAHDKKMQMGHSTMKKSTKGGPALYPNHAKPTRDRANETKKAPVQNRSSGPNQRDRSNDEHRHRSHPDSHQRKHHHSDPDSHQRSRPHNRHGSSPHDDSTSPDPSPVGGSFPGAYPESNRHDDQYDVEANRFDSEANVSDEESEQNPSDDSGEEELIEAYVVRDEPRQAQPIPAQSSPRSTLSPEESVTQEEPEQAPKKPKVAPNVAPNVADPNMNTGGTSMNQSGAQANANTSSDCSLVTTNRYSIIGCLVLWLVIIITLIVVGVTGSEAVAYIAAVAWLVAIIWMFVCCCAHCDCGDGQQQQQQQQQQMVVVNNFGGNSAPPASF